MMGLAESNKGIGLRIAGMAHKRAPYLEREDLCSEAMLSLVRAEKLFNPAKAKFSTYAHYAATHAVNNLIERETRYKRRFHFRLSVVARATENVPRNAEMRSLWTLAQAMLQRVSRRQREVFRLVYVEGLSSSQIAKRIGGTRQNAAQIHRNLLKRLRLEMGISKQVA
jgi:RNA polymerase sigma factor (sigma-70 family)